MKYLKTTLCALALVPMLVTAQPRDRAAPGGDRFGEVVRSELSPQRQGDVTFLCGGVGKSEQQAMMNAARQFDMMLTFAVQGGQYLADVEVEIKNRRGDVVLNARCDGPIMLVDVPTSGSYQVTAQANGLDRRTTVSTGGGKLARKVLLWPRTEAIM